MSVYLCGDHALGSKPKAWWLVDTSGVPVSPFVAVEWMNPDPSGAALATLVGLVVLHHHVLRVTAVDRPLPIKVDRVHAEMRGLLVFAEKWALLLPLQELVHHPMYWALVLQLVVHDPA